VAKLTIDGVELEVPNGCTVLQACEMAGKEIPRFCYHERLSVAGNCRMCLVEMEKSPKPIASCAMPVGDGMVIRTNTPMVRKARQGVMEFLLINHPLDCPICDQGGECDLQDQAMAYGYDRSRFAENKRAVADKDFGPLIQTSMTRCIQCTRCVRFMTEVAGVEDLGAVGRSEHMEIVSAIEGGVRSEVSGNVIDLCPVGALTSKPYEFVARPWEMTKTQSVDVLDAVGSNIRVDARGSKVLRVLPVLNDDINEEWISDKARFSYDGLKRQRLDTPYVRRAGRLFPATWSEAFAAIKAKLDGLPGDRIAALAGDLACAESMTALADLWRALGSPHLDCRQDGAKLDPACRASYLFNTTIAGIEQSDACLIIGSDPRREAAIVNVRLRKRALLGNFPVGVVGPQLDLTYRTRHLGAGPETLARIADGTEPFCETLAKAERPMLILGQGALARADGARVLGAARRIAERFGMVKDGWIGFNVLHRAAARAGGIELGFVPGPGGRDTAAILAGAQSGDIVLVYLLGADEIDMAKLGAAFVVYQGHHGDAGAHRADVILPGCAYTEKDATYVNTEGRAQRGRRAVFPPGEAREDWAIVRALSGALGRPLPYDTLGAVRRRMAEASPTFDAIGRVVPAAWGPFGETGPMAAAPFALPVANFYMTDPITRASETMAECVRVFGPRGDQVRTGTHG
jgi:NADH-quinone oxidoreductase subunit G